MNYHIRIEHHMGFKDITVSARNAATAREIAVRKNPQFTNWQWRGAVAFVNGETPAEEHLSVRLANAGLGRAQ